MDTKHPNADPNIDALEEILRRAGAAHGIYEETVLNGIFDSTLNFYLEGVRQCVST